jgi:hypothetical protein
MGLGETPVQGVSSAGFLAFRKVPHSPNGEAWLNERRNPARFRLTRS